MPDEKPKKAKVKPVRKRTSRADDTLDLKVEKHWCKYNLSDGEVLERSKENAELFKTIEDDEDKKKSIMKDLGSKLDFIKTKHSKESKIIRDGFFHEYAECRKRIDFKTGDVTIYRRDTGEVVEERKITEDERQLELDFNAGEDIPNEIIKFPKAN